MSRVALQKGPFLTPFFSRPIKQATVCCKILLENYLMKTVDTRRL